MRAYAEDTAVPVGKSRSEIDKLLREWGCDGIQWTDELSSDRVMLRFVFARLVDGEAHRFMARFGLTLESEKKIRQRCTYRGYKLAEAKYRQAMDRRGAKEHRLLLLWLKAAFHAVQAGLVTPEVLFLPFLEGKDGQTVAEVAVPQLGTLLKGSAGRLLLGDGR